MRWSPRTVVKVLSLVVAAGAGAATAAPASALSPLKSICAGTGESSGTAGKVCTVAPHRGRVLAAGLDLPGIGTGIGAGVPSPLGPAGSLAGGLTGAFGLGAIGAWIVGGASAALQETASVLGRTTSPQLRSTWFSATYWRMAAIAAVLTLPFLFAAAIQAMLHSDLSLLARAAFGYLPLAMLAVGVAAPLTMLLLSAADELSLIVSSAAGDASGQFLLRAAGAIGSLTVFSQSPFLAFLIGALTVAGALVLWIELLMREAAVYVIVLMLPLAFSALVWPARRTWAIRAVEVLVALILSKFAIVAVLSLGGAAMNASLTKGSLSAWLAGLVLLVLGAFAPWVLLRLVPLAELAAGAAGSLRHEAARSLHVADEVAGFVTRKGDDWAGWATAHMRREAITPDPPAQATPGAAGDEVATDETDRGRAGDERTPAEDGPTPAGDRRTPAGDRPIPAGIADDATPAVADATSGQIDALSSETASEASGLMDHELVLGREAGELGWRRIPRPDGSGRERPDPYGSPPTEGLPDGGGAAPSTSPSQPPEESDGLPAPQEPRRGRL